MKKFKMPLTAIALVVGITSAFATRIAVGEDCYRDAEGDFHVKPAATPGNCNTEEISNNCNFEYTGSGTAGVDQTAANYQPNGTANRRWEP